MTPEDLVDLDLYVEAVYREGQPYWEGEVLRPEDLPTAGRAKAVTDWCKQRGLQVPSKVRVAQNLIEGAWGWLAADTDSEDPRTYPETVTTEAGRRWLASLHEEVLERLGIE